METWNKQLKSMDCSVGSTLQGYLSSLREAFGVNVNFHDLCGLTRMDDTIGHVLKPYLYHNNSFCNYLKKHPATFRDCVRSKNVLRRQCGNQTGPFYGSCYMGIEELKYPIYWNKRLLGFLCVGQFSTDPEAALQRLDKQAAKYGLDADTLKERFLEVLTRSNPNPQALVRQIGMLAEFLALLYERFLRAQGMSDVDKAARTIKDNYLVDQAIAYIQGHYAEPLSLRAIAANCYCNESYLSSLFRAKTGSTLTDYIHRVRLSKAKELLDITKLSITEIAARVGYPDPNYFSRVFRKYAEYSPVQYRSRKT
jgi:AraC-like DNA-binding protein